MVKLRAFPRLDEGERKLVSVRECVESVLTILGHRLKDRIHAQGYLISLADTGARIPEALRERVLEPFFTTKPVGQGTGLGLSITYSIVQKHGGTLELRNENGSGTTAVIWIPQGSEGRN